jgi:preprotein translocase subunit SecD
MRFRTLVICALIVVFLIGALSQAQGAVEIRAASSSAIAGWQRVTAADGETLWVSPQASLTAADIERSELQARGVGVVFTSDGARKMRALSVAQANQRIAVLLDGTAIWAPVVRAPIDREALLSGLSPEQAQRLVQALPRQQ